MNSSDSCAAAELSGYSFSTRQFHSLKIPFNGTNDTGSLQAGTNLKQLQKGV